MNLEVMYNIWLFCLLFVTLIFIYQWYKAFQIRSRLKIKYFSQYQKFRKRIRVQPNVKIIVSYVSVFLILSVLIAYLFILEFGLFRDFLWFYIPLGFTVASGSLHEYTRKYQNYETRSFDTLYSEINALTNNASEYKERLFETRENIQSRIDYLTEIIDDISSVINEASEYQSVLREFDDLHRSISQQLVDLDGYLTQLKERFVEALIRYLKGLSFDTKQVIDENLRKIIQEKAYDEDKIIERARAKIYDLTLSSLENNSVDDAKVLLLSQRLVKHKYRLESKFLHIVLAFVTHPTASQETLTQIIYEHGELDESLFEKIIVPKDYYAYINHHFFNVVPSPMKSKVLRLAVEHKSINIINELCLTFDYNIIDDLVSYSHKVGTDSKVTQNILAFQAFLTSHHQFFDITNLTENKFLILKKHSDRLSKTDSNKINQIELSMLSTPRIVTFVNQTYDQMFRSLRAVLLDYVHLNQYYMDHLKHRNEAWFNHKKLENYVVESLIRLDENHIKIVLFLMVAEMSFNKNLTESIFLDTNLQNFFAKISHELKINFMEDFTKKISVMKAIKQHPIIQKNDNIFTTIVLRTEKDRLTIEKLNKV